MQDQQRVDFVERMRVLYADIFRDGDEGVVHENKLLDVPDYVRDECVVELTFKAREHSMDEAEMRALKAFVASNDIDLKSVADMKSYRSLRLNSFQIRTSGSETKLETSDSIICVRWLDDDDTERYLICVVKKNVICGCCV